jgi:uncharacterized protein (TIGR03437 family)
MSFNSAIRFLVVFLLFAALLPGQTGAPTVPTNGVTNGADYGADVAPGMIITIWGTNLAAKTAAASAVPLPTALEGTTVVVTDGSQKLYAPLFYVSAGQINAQLPFGLKSSTVTVQVQTAVGASAAVSVRVLPRAPRLFTKTMDGKGDAILLHADYKLVDSANPARSGEYLMLYLTGLGAVTPEVAAGAAGGWGTAEAPLNKLSETVTVAVDGQPAAVAFAGLAPYFVGLYQINFQVPGLLISTAPSLVVATPQKESQANVKFAARVDWQSAGSTVIGASGGTLNAPGITLTAPAGALPVGTSLSLLRTDPAAALPADPYRATPYYLLTGLPASSNAPLTITLDPTLTGQDGEAAVVISAPDNRARGPLFLRAKIENGQITATIPAYQPTSSTSGEVVPMAGVERRAVPNPNWMVAAFRGYDYTTSAKKMFVVFFPKNMAGMLDKARQLADTLDKAYDILGQDLRLAWDRRLASNWPIEVWVYPFTDSWICGNNSQKWGTEGDLGFGKQAQNIHLNANMMGTPEQMGIMRSTAAHELFHVLQNLYDPRDAAQIKFGGETPWLWYEEAASTWVERPASSDPPNYVPDTILPTVGGQANYSFIKEGLGGNNTQDHGYGASMFLQYLGQRFGTRIIGDVLKVMGDATAKWPKYGPLEAIERVLPTYTTSNISAVWRDFCRAYMRGDIYGSPGGSPFPNPTQILMLKESGWNFDAPDDPGKTFPWNAPQLSATVYIFKFVTSNFRPSRPLKFSLSDAGGSAEMVIYKIKRLSATSQDWTLLYNGRSDYTLSNAENLKKNGEDIVVMVSNSYAVFPYTNKTPITLSVSDPENYLPELQTTNTASASICGAHWVKYGDGRVLPSPNSCLFTVGSVSGTSCPSARMTWSGQSFTVSGTCPLNDAGSVTSKFSLSGTVDALGHTVETGSFSSTKTSTVSGDVYTDTQSFSIRSVPIDPIMGVSDSGNCRVFSYRFVGADTQSRVSGLSFTHSSGAISSYSYDHTDWAAVRTEEPLIGSPLSNMAVRLSRCQ